MAHTYDFAAMEDVIEHIRTDYLPILGALHHRLSALTP